MISIVLVWLGGVAFKSRPGLSLVLTALGSGWTGMLVAIQIRYVQDVLQKRKRPELVRLASKLQEEYAFECEAGPLKNCTDWQTLVAGLRRDE